MHLCTDFANVGLRSNRLINCKIDEVLTVDLVLRESIACLPHATRVTNSLILTYPLITSASAGKSPLVPQQLNPYGIQVFSINPQRNDLITEFLSISFARRRQVARREGERQRQRWRVSQQEEWRWQPLPPKKHDSAPAGGPYVTKAFLHEKGRDPCSHQY